MAIALFGYGRYHNGNDWAYYHVHPAWGVVADRETVLGHISVMWTDNTAHLTIQRRAGWTDEVELQVIDQIVRQMRKLNRCRQIVLPSIDIDKATLPLIRALKRRGFTYNGCQNESGSTWKGQYRIRLRPSPQPRRVIDRVG